MKRQSPLKRRSAHFIGAALIPTVILLSYLLVPGTHTVSSAPTASPDFGPQIQATQHYLNRTFLTTHTAPVFDSSGGDLIVVCASSHSGVLMAPADSFNNTWISAVGPTSTSGAYDLRTQVWYAKNPKVGPGHTFSVVLSTSQALVISLLVVKGSNISDPIDVVSAIGDDAESQSPHVASPSITTTTGNELLIGFAKSAVGQVWSPGSGYTIQRSATSSFLAAETGFAETPGRYSSRIELSSQGPWQAVTLAVKPRSVSRSSNSNSNN